MSVSKKQLAANRQNAQKSAGPKTDQGKAVAAQNAVKHGLYARDIVINSPHLKEDPSEYMLLFQSLCDELQPQTLFQEYLIRKIANCLWRSRRAVIAETAHISRRLDGVDKDLYYEIHFDSRFKEVEVNDDEEDIEEDTEEGAEEDTEEDDSDDDGVAYEHELAARMKTDIIGMRTLPEPKDCLKILRYEMRLDRQMTRIFRLLKQLQKGHADETPDENKGNP